MALNARKILINLKNISKYKKPWLALHSRGYISLTNSNLSIKIRHDSHLRSKWLHTTSTVHKSVAFKLSDIGEGIRDVVIKEWFVKVGDKVQQFDNICEVQSDKAAVTITSRYDGVITRLYHQVDESALVGQPLVDIELEGSKEEEPALVDEEAEPKQAAPAVANEGIIKNKVLTTPAVRRIAGQFKVDLSTVKATGRNGRVLKEDVLSHLNISSDKSNDVQQDVSVGTVSKSIDASASMKAEVIAEDKIVPITGFTKAMVKSMTEAMKIPHFGFSDEYNVTKLVQSRNSLKEIAQKEGVKLTYMPLIIKAVSQSLKQFPILNSSLDANCENIIYKASHNIGLAMDTPNGLIVPVIKNVQMKSILEIAKELNILQDKGSKGQLGLSDLAGGTFSISNIGIVGGTYTKPVIVPAQVSIGALGKIQVCLNLMKQIRATCYDYCDGETDVLPRFDSEGNVVKAHILHVSWSADHRVIDGATMAKFSNQLKEYLEEPYKLLLDL